MEPMHRLHKLDRCLGRIRHPINPVINLQKPLSTIVQKKNKECQTPISGKSCNRLCPKYISIAIGRTADVKLQWIENEQYEYINIYIYVCNQFHRYIHFALLSRHPDTNQQWLLLSISQWFSQRAIQSIAEAEQLYHHPVAWPAIALSPRYAHLRPPVGVVVAASWRLQLTHRAAIWQ